MMPGGKHLSSGSKLGQCCYLVEALCTNSTQPDKKISTKWSPVLGHDNAGQGGCNCCIEEQRKYNRATNNMGNTGIDVRFKQR